VMPWLEELFPPEDSLDLLERRGRKPEATLEIAVLRLPSLSNFSDLDPLEAEPTVRIRWLTPGQELGSPDAVVVPGSKQTLRDLSALRDAGLDRHLRRYVAEGGQVFGLCGGLQMLGREISDPGGLEGHPDTPTPHGLPSGPMAAKAAWWPAPTSMGCLKAVPGAGAGSTCCANAKTWPPSANASPTTVASAMPSSIAWPTPSRSM